MDKVTNMILKSTKIFYSLGGTPCIVVMGVDWCSRGRGFNSFCKSMFYYINLSITLKKECKERRCYVIASFNVDFFIGSKKS